MNADVHCPVCSSLNVIFSRKRALHVCEDCGHEFTIEKAFIPRRLFISYGHDEHTAVAERLIRDLKTRGHLIWFDKDRLHAGHDWESRIEAGLDWLAADKANAAIVLLLTPHSVRRPDGYCLNEIAGALRRGVRIVPLMVLESEPPLSICRIQWLDMRKCIPIHENEALYRPRFERLLKAIEEGQLDFEGTQQRLIKTLQPLEFDAEILRHTASFTGRQWVFDAIRRWLAAPPAHRIFWISGGPGVGKTAISAVLSSRYPEVAALHLCKFGHAQKGDPRHVVTSVVYQLSTQLPEYEAQLGALDLERLVQDDASTIFDNLLAQPLARLSAPNRPIVILIDALDEAGGGGHNELAGFLATEFPKTPSWLRLVLTSRPESAIKGPFQDLNPFILSTETEANRDDIRSYLRREMETFTRDRPDADHVVEQILERSEGVFLYVERVCHDIRCGNLRLDRLDSFPRGLGGIFWQFFERQFRNKKAFKEEVCPALRVILAACEPLPVTVLQGLFNWKDEDLRGFLRELGSLFPATMETGHEVIKPFHKSLADWLADEQKAGPFFVSAAEGHRFLAESGLMVVRSDVTRLADYLRRHLPAHLIEAGRVRDFCDLILTPAYMDLVRQSGEIVELLALCAQRLEIAGLFSTEERERLTQWLHSTPEDILGKAMHEKWYADQEQRTERFSKTAAALGTGGLRGLGRFQPWSSLSVIHRSRRWLEVAETFTTLREAGLGVRLVQGEQAPLIDFTCAEVERCAENEHERWCREKRAEDWTHGPALDPQKRQTPYLMRWIYMPEAVREYDRQVCRYWPVLFAQGGYEIFRLEVAGQ